jgi:hypothetical protein
MNNRLNINEEEKSRIKNLHSIFKATPGTGTINEDDVGEPEQDYVDGFAGDRVRRFYGDKKPKLNKDNRKDTLVDQLSNEWVMRHLTLDELEEIRTKVYSRVGNQED